MERPRILVAGIGNIFLGDDAFGVEVARRLMRRAWPNTVRVADYGIRGYDLAYALLDDFEVVILVDATPRGGAPGTLYLVEPEVGEASTTAHAPSMLDAHGMNPVQVLRLVEALGGRVRRLLVVGCEPSRTSCDQDMEMGLSDPVRAAVEEATLMVESLVERILRGEPETHLNEAAGASNRERSVT
jgi:hydrogenase maturation protease